ncbi:MAG: VWA domain-containing protein [Ideonella sp.]|nr:VWA domain-containing protein [Ideonella sp.]
MNRSCAAPATPRAEPLEAIAGFAALLRDHGLAVGVAEQQAMVRAALALPIERAAHLNDAWRSIACHDAADWRRWRDLFDRYWHPQRLRGSTRVSGQTRPARDLRQVVAELQRSLADPTGAGRRPDAPAPMDSAIDSGADQAVRAQDDPGAPRAAGGATRTEALHDRRLSEWLPQDLAELERLAERVAAALRRRLTRRWRSDPAGRRLDLRRTLRASLRTGGLPVEPVWRRPRREPPRLHILVDVSRSMETHAQLFLRIARAFVTASTGTRTRVFVFHTRLAEVTPLLQRDSPAVQEKVNAVTAGFGGGTRIATSLEDFVGVHAGRQLHRGARVWVLSDGYDADPPERLAEAVRHLAARGARLAWWHPGDRPPASRAVEQLCADPAARAALDGFIRLQTLGDLAAAAPRLRGRPPAATLAPARAAAVPDGVTGVPSDVPASSPAH